VSGWWDGWVQAHEHVYMCANARARLGKFSQKFTCVRPYSIQVFVAAEAEYLENKEDDKGDDKKKDKNDSKKDSKKDGKKGADDEKKKKKAPLSFEAELYKDFRKEVQS